MNLWNGSYVVLVWNTAQHAVHSTGVAGLGIFDGLQGYINQMKWIKLFNV